MSRHAVNVTFPWTFDLGALGEWEAVITGVFTPGDPGRTYGPPEDCYPPEGAEFEITGVSFKVQDPTPFQWGIADALQIAIPCGVLTDDEWERLIEAAERAAGE